MAQAQERRDLEEQQRQAEAAAKAEAEAAAYAADGGTLTSVSFLHSQAPGAGGVGWVLS